MSVDAAECPICDWTFNISNFYQSRCCYTLICKGCLPTHECADDSRLRAVDIKPESDKVSESVVDVLEHWLDMAKSGKLSDVVVVGIAGNSVIHGASKTMNFLSRIGAVEAAKMEWYHHDVLHKEGD